MDRSWRSCRRLILASKYGIHIGGCLLARTDEGMTVVGPRLHFRRRSDGRDQIRFAAIMCDELREAVTEAAVREWSGALTNL
jgi:hypothetical protein